MFEDYELVAEYIDAIRQLTSAVKSEKADKDAICALSDHVLWIQQVRTGAAAGVAVPARPFVTYYQSRCLTGSRPARPPWLPQRIETEVGRREPSVRELFRTASQMVSQRFIIIHRGGQPQARSTSSLARMRGGDGPRQRPKSPEDDAV